MKQTSRPLRRRWGDPLRYWRRLRLLTAVLLAAWLLVTLLVPWYARELNQWHLAGMPLGLWMASQGAIAIYLVLVLVYALMSDWLERKLDRAGEGAAAHRPGRG